MAVHKVTFLPVNVTVDVDDEKYPLADHGRPGSLLDIALAHDVHLEHNCGGSCACTTCHVVVREGEEHLSPMEQDEEDRLDTAEGLTLHSRLGCQAVVRGDVVLLEQHPDTDPLTVRFTDLHKWVVALPGFADDPKGSNESVLEAIQMKWYEEYRDR
jgi:2Fe-2S ferredoxin